MKLISLSGRFIKSKSFNKIFLLIGIAVSIFSYSCNNNTTPATGISYICPMPEDSIFSDKPGKCPKCGMDLVPVHETHTDSTRAEVPHQGFTCPMHPQIQSSKPGICPICGMALERIKTDNEPLSLSLEMLLKPANQAVVANVPMVHMAQREEDLELKVLGTVEYDPLYAQNISSKVSGRITKLYVQYRYQKINQGQPIMEIYSKELLEAQNNYLFLLKTDPGNSSLIAATRQKLLLAGMSRGQIEKITQSGKALFAITVFSNASGVAREDNPTNKEQVILSGAASPLTLKEGMYVEKGQTLFNIINPSKGRIALQIFPQHQDIMKQGDTVRIYPESQPGSDFRATIAEIVPYYQPQSKTLIARIPFDNRNKKLPIGSTVRAKVFTGYKNAHWLPEEAVISLGLDKVVFVREQDGFIARKIQTGIVSKHLVQILDGLQTNEAVAANAGFLVDSESFIMTKVK